MRKLLNVLFVTSEDAYLSLDGENVVVSREKQEIGRFPLHNLSGIFCFTYAGASPALMGACGRKGIDLTFCSPTGRFLARAVGEENGNVLLRREQYRIADDQRRSCRIARNMVLGKLYNARWSVERTRRDHPDRIDGERFAAASETLLALRNRMRSNTESPSRAARTSCPTRSRRSPPRPRRKRPPATITTSAAGKASSGARPWRSPNPCGRAAPSSAPRKTRWCCSTRNSPPSPFSLC